MPELASLEISPELLARQNFRIPPMVEPTFEGSDAAFTAAAAAAHLGGNGDGGGGGGGGPISAAYAYGHRRAHSLRSMSLGSIRSAMDQYTSRQHENNVMYNYDNSNQKQQSPTISHYAHQQQHQQPTMMYGVPPAYPGIPSPSSLSSTPGTPSMSPIRAQHQQHQRHYSISSTSSRVDTRDMLGYRPEHQRPSDASFSHLAGDIGFFDRSSHHHHHHQQHTDTVEHHSDNTKGTNIGQLLNPVHPLNSPTTTTTTTTTPSTATSSSSPHMFSQQQQQQQQLPGSHLVTSASSSSTSSSSASMAHPYEVNNKDKDDLVDYRHHSGLSTNNYSVMHHTHHKLSQYCDSPSIYHWSS